MAYHRKTSPFFYDTELICLISDINMVDLERDTFFLSNRLFAYETNIKKIKFVIDLFEARKHIENSTPKINDWRSFDLGSIVGENKKYFNISFHPCIPRLQDSVSFLSFEQQLITVARLPYLSKIEMKGDSEKSKANAAQNNREISSQTLPNVKVDFYRWNPSQNKILIVSRRTTIIVRDLSINKYLPLRLDPREMESIGTVIIDADWDYTGSFFIVTFDNFSTIVFDQYLKAKGLFVEKRSEEKVLILNSRKTTKHLSIDVFTCGIKCKKTGPDFKYGMMNLTVEEDEVINL